METRATRNDASSGAYTAVFPFAAALGTGACLLFLSEPMVGKLLLPRLGGAPAVWNTCMLFFQCMLLAGYAWVHFGIRWLGIRRHAVLHALLVLGALLWLPPAVSASDPPTATTPIPWLIGTLLASIGLPFFVLASTGPLVQRWFAETAHPRASDPYFLYASSNVGSLAGLLLYPLVLEPALGLGAQASVWAVAFLTFVVLLAFAGLRSTRTPAPAMRAARQAVAQDPAAHAPGRRGTGPLRWTFIAFVPSALLLTVTTHVTTDIAPVPLLWVLPLGIYLATFIIAFSAEHGRLFRAAAGLQPLLLLAVGMALILDAYPPWTLALHLGVFAITGFVAHGQLVRERPGADRLTSFYLWVSVGGALGGVFGAVLAPVLLSPRTEYLTLILFACLARPVEEAAHAWSRWAVRTVIAVPLVAGLTWLARSLTPGGAWSILSLTPPTLFFLATIHAMRRRPVGMVVAVGTALAAFHAIAPDPGRVILRERNFFSALTIEDNGEYRSLLHGRTLHGAEFVDAGLRLQPTTYYGEAGPVGDVFEAMRPALDRARIGAIGLGAGTIACYARPGQRWDFYEINPAVVRLARDTTYFRFVSDCAPDARFILGDARLRLAEGNARGYGLLVVDAFSSDAIPVHLITREAFQLYASRLARGGVLAVHITNRYLDLAPVIAAHARSLGLQALIRRDDDATDGVRYPSDWVVLSRRGPALTALSRLDDWQPLEPEPGFRPWTDDYSNVLSALVVLRDRRDPAGTAVARGSTAACADCRPHP